MMMAEAMSHFPPGYESLPLGMGPDPATAAAAAAALGADGNCLRALSYLPHVLPMPSIVCLHAAWHDAGLLDVVDRQQTI